VREAPTTGTGRGYGRVLVFVYGIFALAATGRSSLQLATKASEAPLPYTLSAVAAVIYVVATYALATGRRGLALGAVGIELAGVLSVGVTSLLLPEDYPDATVWSDFGAGYGYVPLVLPLVGLWWLLRGSRGRDGESLEGDLGRNHF
jgi:hypothetical protein